VYANIFVFELEYELVKQYLSSTLLLKYFRFVDDLFLILRNSEFASTIIPLLNSLDPNIVFNCITSPTEGEFLDTVVFKGPRFSETGIFDVRVHQKMINRYLYIPYFSFHTTANKLAWIRAELIRYIRNTSSISDYVEIKKKFFHRLRARGYPIKFLLNIMNTVRYSSRPSFLSEKNKIDDNNFPLIFTTTYHPSISHNEIKSALLTHWKKKGMDQIYKNQLPIIGYKRTRNLKEMLMKSRYVPPSTIIITPN
jgi:hypothetical protein